MRPPSNLLYREIQNLEELVKQAKCCGGSHGEKISKCLLRPEALSFYQVIIKVRTYRIYRLVSQKSPSKAGDRGPESSDKVSNSLCQQIKRTISSQW